MLITHIIDNNDGNRRKVFENQNNVLLKLCISDDVENVQHTRQNVGFI